MQARKVRTIREDLDGVFITYEDGSTYRYYYSGWYSKSPPEIAYHSYPDEEFISSDKNYFSLYNNVVKTWRRENLYHDREYAGYHYTNAKKILTQVKQIETGLSRTYFLMMDGTVKTCGTTDNPKGVLGLGELSNSKVPITLPGLKNVKKISTANAWYGEVLFLHDDGTVSGCITCLHPGFNSMLLGITRYPANTDIVKLKGLSSIKDITAGPSNFFIRTDGSVQYACHIESKPELIQLKYIKNVNKIIYYYEHLVFILKDGEVKKWNTHDTRVELKNADPTSLPGLSDIKEGVINRYSRKRGPDCALAFFVNSKHELITYDLGNEKIINDIIKADGIPTTEQLFKFYKNVPDQADDILRRIINDPDEFKCVVTSDTDLALLAKLTRHPAFKQSSAKAAQAFIETRKNELTLVGHASRALAGECVNPNSFFAKLPNEILVKIASKVADNNYVSKRTATKEAISHFNKP